MAANFGRKKEEAIAALPTQRNIEEAARSIGVAPNTLLKWRKLLEFETAYRDARKAAYRSDHRGQQQVYLNHILRNSNFKWNYASFLPELT